MTEAAFYMCAYEFAIRTVNSPWCQLLDEDDAKVKVQHIQSVWHEQHQDLELKQQNRL